MILKSIALQNFRSYGEELTKIDLDRGILLFEGDIGSGKSSILYAIEFALFGVGEMESRFILRSSASNARVELEFEVGGKFYKIIRCIERKGRNKSIQTRGWISEDGGREAELSPTELKARVLQILNFKEKLGKATSRIFRYAIFTPQELMREVLAQSPDERIETLRRAFGIEDYSFASSNSEIIVSKLGQKTLVYSEISRNLPNKEAELSMLAESLSKHKRDLESEEKELAKISQRVDENREMLGNLESELQAARALETIIPQLEKALSTQGEQLASAKVLLSRYEQTLKEVERAKRQIASLKPEYERYLKGKSRLRELETVQDQSISLEKSIADLSRKVSVHQASLKATLDSKLEELGKLESVSKGYSQNLLELGTLKRSLDSVSSEFSSKNGIDEEMDQTNLEIGAASALKESRLLELEERKLQYSKIDDLSKESECPLCKQKLSKQHMTLLGKEFRERIAHIESEISQTSEKIERLEVKLEKLRSRKTELKKKQIEAEALQKRIFNLEQIQKLQNKTRDEIEALREETRKIEKEINEGEFSHEDEVELASHRAKRETLRDKLKELSELRNLVRQLESSDVERSYFSAENAIARSTEAKELLVKQQEALEKIEHTISETNRELRNKREELEQIQPLIFQHAKIKEELQTLEKLGSDSKTRFDKLSEAISFEERQIEPIEKEVEDLRQSAKKASLYRAFASWLETLFVPSVRDIETYVLESINDEFRQIFQKWFAMLVEDLETNVSLDERFTPLVEQAGYELNVQSLSGGERTAIALAYRLALNYMVKRANEAVQTNLLILDEPTEGFSKEQIYRLRNVLEEVECNQIILVSHERDLESMADKVYTVEKVAGESVVRAVS